MGVSIVIKLLGGVALFLLGMSLMGDGLKKVAGNRLELVLYKLSNTPLKGILLGTGVTAIIQSSSATSVMVVGFVNSEMMKVRQSIGVIMGAIIGTSVTGWVICLSELGGGEAGVASLLSTEVLTSVIAVVGIVLKMASKRNATKYVGDILLGFAVLMFGMKAMSGAVSGLKDNPAFITLLTTFENPFLGIIFGLIFTAILQSASATVGIVQALSSTGMISFEVALPIILGIGIGASVPVLVSAVGSTIDGKRASLSYLVVNVLMAIIFGILFYTVNAIHPLPVMSVRMNSVKIAELNSIYRLFSILILSPFIPQIERMVNALIKPDKTNEEEMKYINRLEKRFLAYPPLAVEHSRLAINSMAQTTKQNYFEAIKLMTGYSDEQFQKAKKLESLVDKFEDRIGKYLMNLAGREMPDNLNRAIGEYLHTITDFERISDHSLNLAESFLEIHEKKLIFSNQGIHDVTVLAEAVGEMLSTVIKGFSDKNLEIIYMAEGLEEVIDDLCDEIKLSHIDRLQREECTLQNGYVLNDLLTNFERIGDHCANIAIVMIARSKGLERHEYSGMLKQIHDERVDNYRQLYSEKYRNKLKEIYE